jgi:hypothetical protein
VIQNALSTAHAPIFVIHSAYDTDARTARETVRSSSAAVVKANDLAPFALGRAAFA